MPPREDLILFLDLETTGTDEVEDSIIEVGLSLISTDAEQNYPEVGSFSMVAIPSDRAFVRMMGKKVVREMHEANGLLAEIVDLRDETTMHELYDEHKISSVEDAVVRWLDGYVQGNTTHIPLGGSGVLHFDRKFIKAKMPRFDQRLTHWAYDMGVFRRMFIKAGVPPYSQEGKTHRALDDARVHADEFRYYQKFVALGGYGA